MNRHFSLLHSCCFLCSPLVLLLLHLLKPRAADLGAHQLQLTGAQILLKSKPHTPLKAPCFISSSVLLLWKLFRLREGEGRSWDFWILTQECSVLGCMSHAGLLVVVPSEHLHFIPCNEGKWIAMGQLVNASHPTSRKLYFCRIPVSHIYSDQGTMPKPRPSRACVLMLVWINGRAHFAVYQIQAIAFELWMRSDTLKYVHLQQYYFPPKKQYFFFFFSRPFLDYIYVFVLVCRIAMQIYNHIVLCFKIISIPKSKPLFLSCLFSHPLLKRGAHHLHTVLFLSCGRYYLKSKISVSRFFCSVFLSLCWGILPWLLLYLFPCIISQWSSRSCTVRKRYNSSLVVFLDSFPAGITFQHKQELHRRIMSLD